MTRIALPLVLVLASVGCAEDPGTLAPIDAQPEAREYVAPAGDPSDAAQDAERPVLDEPVDVDLHVDPIVVDDHHDPDGDTESAPGEDDSGDREDDDGQPDDQDPGADDPETEDQGPGREGDGPGEEHDVDWRDDPLSLRFEGHFTDEAMQCEDQPDNVVIDLHMSQDGEHVVATVDLMLASEGERGVDSRLLRGFATEYALDLFEGDERDPASHTLRVELDASEDGLELRAVVWDQERRCEATLSRRD